jgi:hypothetical protein
MEAKIKELETQRVYLKSEEDKISSLRPSERVKFIVLRQEFEKDINLLKSLL